MTTLTDAGSFSNYWDKVAELLGGVDPKHKTAAIEGTAAATFAADGATNVQKLWVAMDGNRWANPASASDMNWIWRTQNTKEGKSSKEVALERKLFDLGGCERWTYQMPTSSGLEGSSAGKRRSIDLVHKTGSGHYTLIELKCDSDHPFYAAFEVMGYGLAYLHARRHLTSRDASVHEVLSAQRIDLLVLGPRDWYCYTKRNGTRASYQLAALERALTAGLAGLAALATCKPAMPPRGIGFRFAAYASRPDDTATAAQEIVDLFDGRAPWPPTICEGLA